MNRALRGFIGGIVGGIIAIAANVVVAGIAILAYPDDPSASSIAGVTIMIFFPIGIIVGIRRGLRKADEETEPEPKIWAGMPAEKNILQVCAGSGAGRMPFVMVSRAAGAEAVLNGCWLTFASKPKGGPAWSFRALSRDASSAQTLGDALKKQEVYSISPGDYGIRTIMFYRDDWGIRPKWIGGDIAGAEVDPNLYRFGGNNVYELMEELAQPSQAPRG